MNRSIEKIVNAIATSDGDGVKISRSIGSRMLPELDPFLLLDELRSDDAADYVGGFPSHPHRGFETVTYMLEGQMRHKDSAGNEGVIRSGDIQWMTAGSGIIHSEMPEQNEGRLWGFQLWINLPATQKMRKPRYQEIASAQIPEIKSTESKLRVLAGQVDDVLGSVQDITTKPLLLDAQLKAGDKQILKVPNAHTGIIYVYKGSMVVGGTQLHHQQLGHLSSGDTVEFTAGNDGVGALILAAEPLNEPVFRAGPFVMSTRQELEKAFSDYKSGSLIKE